MRYAIDANSQERGRYLFGIAVFSFLTLLWLTLPLMWMVGYSFLEMYFHKSSVECLFWKTTEIPSIIPRTKTFSSKFATLSLNVTKKGFRWTHSPKNLLKLFRIGIFYKILSRAFLESLLYICPFFLIT